MKSSILKTLENCEESISSTLRIRNSKKPLRTRVRSWKHQWLLLCIVKLRRIVGVVHPTKIRQNLRVFWKLMNPQECVWEIQYRSIMKTILQEKEKIHFSTTIWFTNLFLCLKLWRFRQRKQRWTRNGKNWRKFRRGTWQKSEARNRWSRKQGRRALQFILPHWWTSVIWRMPNWKQSTKNTKVELHFEATLWKIILDLMQYSLNKGLQHLKWQRLRSWISSPDCLVAMDKQQTQCLLIPRYEWNMLPNYWKFPNRNVQTFVFVYHDTNGQNHGPAWKTQSFVPLKRNLYGHLLAGLLWEKQFEKILLQHGWEKVSNWECLFVHRETGLFLSVYVDDIKLAGRKQNIDPMWNVLNKEVDLGEPTSFLHHVYLGCTPRQCEISKDIVDNYRTMFKSRISAGGTVKLPYSENFRISSWSFDMEGHAKKCVERYCELVNKTTQQLYKVFTPCIDDHLFKEEEMKYVGELSKVCSRIVQKCLYLTRIGWPDIFYGQWTNLQDRLRNGPRACDKRLNRVVSYIHHTCDYKQHCHVGNTAEQCRFGLFQDSDS